MAANMTLHWVLRPEKPVALEPRRVPITATVGKNFIHTLVICLCAIWTATFAAFNSARWPRALCIHWLGLPLGFCGAAGELGRKLKWDPEKEECVGDDEANSMLSREQRKGYELPS